MAILNEHEKIELITQNSLDINEVKDLDMILERILKNVRRFFNADAGSIYLKVDDKLKFSHTQNETLQKRLGSGQKLIYNTFFVPINNKSISGYVANNSKVVNIPDVYSMSESEPYTFDSLFDKLSNYQTVSMLAVPLTNQQSSVLGVMQIINARDEQDRVVPFTQADESFIKHFATSAALTVERAQLTRNIILRMIGMAELRDPKETGAHVNRVGAYSVEIYEVWARKRGLSESDIQKQKDILRLAAMLHDVGKVAISDLILKKPAKLTEEEYSEMKSHCHLGARLFKDPQSDFDVMAADIALNHHEKWDGTGYPGHFDPVTEMPMPGFEGPDNRPRPKKGEEIPIVGRIVAVADVYDALCSRRSYKPAWDSYKVLDELRRGSGTHFDPEVLDAFFASVEVIKSIADRFPDE